MTAQEHSSEAIDVTGVLVDFAAPAAGHASPRRHKFARSVIRAAILGGALPTGTKIPEPAVIEALSISRTPVREAFRLLEGEGLIAYSPSRGVIVRGLSRSDLVNICEILETLEPLAAHLAAERATPAQVDEIRNALDLMQFHSGRKQWAETTKQGIRFHELVYEASANDRLKATLIDLRAYVRAARETSLATPGRGEKSVDEHAQLYEAISAHDAERSAEIARHHIHNFRLRAGLG